MSEPYTQPVCERCDVCEKLTTLRKREGVWLCRQCEAVLDA